MSENSGSSRSMRSYGHHDPQPEDLSTPERLATTGRAVAQGIGHEAKGEHETAAGALQHVADGGEG